VWTGATRTPVIRTGIMTTIWCGCGRPLLWLVVVMLCTPQPTHALQVLGERDREQRIDTEAQLRALYSAVLRFHEDSSAWPKSLNAACTPSPLDCLMADTGQVPIDVWGSTVSYVPRSDGFELRSFGPDRRPVTSDDLLITYPLDRVIARQISGCYRPLQGWWTRGQTVVRLDTIPGTLYRYPGNYSLTISLPRHPVGTEWFPVGKDSISLRWAYGSHEGGIRMKRLGDTLRGRVDFEDVDSRGELKHWSSMLTLVRSMCEA